MNDLRNEIVDAVIESVFRVMPHLSDMEFRGLVCRILGVIDFAVREVACHERHLRYLRNLQRTKN
jgi:hypothetical protein